MQRHDPSPLLSYTGRARSAGTGRTRWPTCCTDLDRQFPGIRFRMVDEQDRLRTAHARVPRRQRAARAARTAGRRCDAAHRAGTERRLIRSGDALSEIVVRAGADRDRGRRADRSLRAGTGRGAEAAGRWLHPADPHADRADHLLHGGDGHRRHGQPAACRAAWALYALGYFEIVTTMALMLGLVVVNLVAPGSGMHVDPATLDATRVSSLRRRRPQSQGIVDFLLNIIPGVDVRRLRQGRDPAGAAGRDAVRLRAAGLRHARGDAAQRHRGLLGRAVHAWWATSRGWRPSARFGAMAFTIGSQGIGALAPAGEADAVLLRHLPAVRVRRAGADRAPAWLLDLQADAANCARSC